MMDGKHRIDQRGLAAPATMLIPFEDLFPAPGIVLPIGPIPMVSSPAQPRTYIEVEPQRQKAPFAASEGAEQEGHFPSLPLAHDPRHGRCRRKALARLLGAHNRPGWIYHFQLSGSDLLDVEYRTLRTGL
jgi:hypothetical protein